LDSEKLIDILGEIGKGILAYEDKIRKNLGLTEAEFRGILCIGKGERITCQEFAKRMDLSISRGSRVVDRLCVKSHIERVDCDADRRCKNIWLTEKGREIRRIITQEIQNIEDTLTAEYPEAKIFLLKNDLKRLLRTL
jgi:DNA-binding MarR family transcriptional regulator